MSKKVNKASFTYGGTNVSLSKSKTTAAVQYVKGAGKKQTEEDLDGFELLTSEKGIDKTLDQMREKPEVAVGTHVWNIDEDGQEEAPLIPTGYLYLEFLADADPAAQKALLDNLHLNIVEVVDVGAFRVVTTPQSPNPVKCAIALQESEIVMVAEPEFVSKPAERGFSEPNGSFISTQWHLQNTGNRIPVVDVQNSVFASTHFKAGADAKVKDAWRHLQSTGSSSIRIAVIDTGFAIEHPQLRGNGYKIKNPFNAANRGTDVSPWVRRSDGRWAVVSHGTSCAAVAAGALDHLGILGAAPNASIIPIKLDVLTDTAIKAAFEHAYLNGADIISCSLGYPKPMPLSTYVHNYIRKVARDGRGGKGIPIFVAAGNANSASNYKTRTVSDFAAHPDVICITASNSLDQRSSYSFYGPNAHNCAPSNGDNGVGITTATIEINPDGQNATLGYTSSFGGTSSAAPLTAGVCALMLTANSQLTVAAIRNILRSTSDKIGSSSSYNGQGHSIYYGYGRINALKAVQMARQNSNIPSSGTVTTTPTTPPSTTTPPTSGGSTSGGGEVPKAKVVSTFLNVRSGPSTTYPKVGRLNQGDIVYLLENHGSWWRIGNETYIHGDYIQRVSSDKHGMVISSTLNVRSGPSVANSKVGMLKYGNQVNILETTATGWHRIAQGQWVYGKYIRMV
ncbi:MAG: S8 family serine peptidase [Saprospiraceae bacterium]